MMQQAKGQPVVIHTASLVFPVSSPPIENGAVAVDTTNSRILFVGSQREVTKQYPEATTQDHPEHALTPAFINAHSHLDFAHLKGGIPLKKDETFFQWICKVIDAQFQWSEEEIKRGIDTGIQELLLSGTVLSGEIVHHAAQVEKINASSLHAVFFHEVTGLKQQRAEENLRNCCERMEKYQNNGKHHLALHSPYGVAPKVLKEIGRKQDDSEIIYFHLAESAEEREHLAGKETILKQFLKKKGLWDESWKAPKTSPVEWFYDSGLLRPESIAVHMVHLSEKDFRILEKARPSVCLCPRSNRWLNNGTPPFQRLYDMKLNICLGTDGKGSVENLDILQELFALQSIAPSLSFHDALHFITLNPASALGMERELGSLEKGKQALFQVFPLSVLSHQNRNHTSFSPVFF